LTTKANNNPLVSIIIPTYNRGDMIGETLDTVASQTYKNWECIVVDDGSNDNTELIMAKYVSKDPRFTYVHRPETHLSGGNGARNYGFEIARGEFIQWFDSDDLMKENFLEAKMKEFERHPECQSIISRFTFFDEQGIQEKQYDFWHRYPRFFENTVTVKIPVWTPSIIFRKSFLQKIGERLDESLKRMQEYEFFTRIFVRHHHKTYLLDKSLCLVRRHDESKTADFTDRKTEEMFVSYYKANRKIINVLLEQGKMTKNLEDYFLKDHKRYITYSFELDYHDLALRFRKLAETYLRANKKYFRLLRFRIGFFFYRIIPVRNFFLVYELNNKMILWTVRNFRRSMKIVGKKGYVTYVMNKVRKTGNKKTTTI
jgi:glycosyltransferase involved in cell wall biosynthesis